MNTDIKPKIILLSSLTIVKSLKRLGIPNKLQDPSISFRMTVFFQVFIRPLVRKRHILVSLLCVHLRPSVEKMFL